MFFCVRQTRKAWICARFRPSLTPPGIFLTTATARAGRPERSIGALNRTYCAHQPEKGPSPRRNSGPRRAGGRCDRASVDGDLWLGQPQTGRTLHPRRQPPAPRRLRHASDRGGPRRGQGAAPQATIVPLFGTPPQDVRQEPENDNDLNMTCLVCWLPGPECWNSGKSSG
jgi:hypothetical protein